MSVEITIVVTITNKSKGGQWGQGHMSIIAPIHVAQQLDIYQLKQHLEVLYAQAWINYKAGAPKKEGGEDDNRSFVNE